jgi:hypothetical protein
MSAKPNSLLGIALYLDLCLYLFRRSNILLKLLILLGKSRQLHLQVSICVFQSTNKVQFLHHWLDSLIGPPGQLVNDKLNLLVLSLQSFYQCFQLHVFLRGLVELGFQS